MSDYDEISRALNHLDPNDRDTWFKMGAAIKDELGEDGFSLWDDWSRGGESYKSADAKAVWKSIKPNFIHIETLFKYARDNGYRPEKPYTPPSADELARRAAAAEAKRLAEEKQQQIAQEKARRTAYGIWQHANPVDNHAYAKNKGLDSATLAGLRQSEYQGKMHLIVPLYADKKLVNVQSIDEDGGKRFLPNGRVKGAYTIVGDWKQREQGIVITEGLATASSIHQATGKPVVVAFNANNLIAVAETLSKNLPEHIPVTFAADNDASQTGIKKAQQASLYFDGRAQVLMPEFTAEQVQRFQQQHGKDKLPSDFNDLHQLNGLAAVAENLGTRPQVVLPNHQTPLLEPEEPVIVKSSQELSREELMKSNYWRVKNGYDSLPENEPKPEAVTPEQARDNQQFADAETEKRLARQQQMARTDWKDFPPVVRNGNMGELKNEPEYRAAKSGDVEKSAQLVDKLLKSETFEQIKSMIGNEKPILVPILAKEANGNNRIPLSMVYALSQKLDLPFSDEIYQINKVSRTDTGIYHRYAFQPEFDGKVEAGKSYLIVDDTLSVGGTIAGLKGYIENHGGKVLGATVMTAHESALDIVIKPNMLQSLNQKHGDSLNQFWQNEFGYGIDKLTQHEAGHLKKPSLEQIQERINEARDAVFVSPFEQDNKEVEYAKSIPQRQQSTLSESDGAGRIEERDKGSRNIPERVLQESVQSRQSTEPALNANATAVPLGAAKSLSEEKTVNHSENKNSIESAQLQQKKGQSKEHQTEAENSIEYVGLHQQKEVKADNRIPEPMPLKRNEQPAKEPSTTVSSSADIDKKMPEHLKERYVVANGKYLAAENGKTVLFEDKGKSLNTSRSDAQTVSDMLDVAQSKGWDSIKISGSREFKSMMWLEAESRGIRTTGYAPSPEDLALLERRREQRAVNHIESDVRPTPERVDSSSKDAAILSETEKLKQASAAPEKEGSAMKSIPTEAVNATDKVKEQVLNPELEAAKASYAEKVETLPEAEQKKAQFYERVALNALDEFKLEGVHRDTALLNFYTNAAEMVQDGKYNQPDPMRAVAPEQDKSISNTHQTEQDVEIER